MGCLADGGRGAARGAGWVDKLATTRRARHQGKPADTGDESVPLLSASTIRDIVYLTSGIQHRPADWEVMVPSRL
jgi:hypothetical protein